MNHARKIEFEHIIVRDEDNARRVYLGIEELAADIAANGLPEPSAERRGSSCSWIRST